MRGINFVVSVRSDQHQVPHIRLGEKILDQVERCRIKPLQIIEEQGQWMLRPREYADESPEDQLESALRVLWWEDRDRWLFSDDVLQFWDEVHDQQSVRTQRVTKGGAPDAQVCFGLRQKQTDETLKGLR